MRIDAMGIDHYYGAEQVLKGVNLSLKSGGFVAIIGESGSGKTTLLSILSTLLQPSAGSVTFEGKKLSEWGDINPFRRHNIGFVFQFHYLIAHLTVRENVALSALDISTVDPLLAQLGIERLRHRYSDEISGGGASTCRHRASLGQFPLGGLCR